MKYIKGLIWIIIAVVLVIIGVRAVQKKKAEEARISMAKTYKINVSALKLKKNRVILTLPYLATVKSDKDIIISTKVAERVLSSLKAGDKVKKGEIVLRLDDSSLQEKLQALELSMNSLKDNIDAKKIVLKNLLLTHKRTKELLDVKGASIEQYQGEADKIALTKAGIKALQNNVSIIKTKIKEIKNLISYAIIKSPINGRVSASFVNAGEMAMPGHPLLKIANQNGKYLAIALPPSQKIQGIIYNGKTYHVVPLNETIHGLDLYRANIKTDANEGERVDIKVIVFDNEAVEVPLNGILQIGNKNYIFIVNNDKAVQTKVKILSSGEEGFAIGDKFVGKKIVLAKPDLFLKIIGGVGIKVKGE